MKEDNTKIFTHLEEMMQQRRVIAVTEESEGSGEVPKEPESNAADDAPAAEFEEPKVVFKSSAASKEQELFMKQQMELNKNFLKKLGNAKLSIYFFIKYSEKQKELIKELREKSGGAKSGSEVGGATGFQITQAVELALQEERSKNGDLERTVNGLKAKLMTFENKMSEINNILLEYKQRKG